MRLKIINASCEGTTFKVALDLDSIESYGDEGEAGTAYTKPIFGPYSIGSPTSIDLDSCYHTGATTVFLENNTAELSFGVDQTGEKRHTIGSNIYRQVQAAFKAAN